MRIYKDQFLQNLLKYVLHKYKINIFTASIILMITAYFLHWFNLILYRECVGLSVYNLHIPLGCFLVIRNIMYLFLLYSVSFFERNILLFFIAYMHTITHFPK